MALPDKGRCHTRAALHLRADAIRKCKDGVLMQEGDKRP